MKAEIAVIGGSGLYQLEGTAVKEETAVSTPFGDPSDKIAICDIKGLGVAFLPRHGRGHRLTPTEVPSRANIWALKSLGVKQVVAVSAVGSLTEEYRPGEFAVCDQLIDRTRSRTNSFFGDGVVGHVGFADPYCQGMREKLTGVLNRHELPFHDSGTLVCMEGPLFSTRAESRLYRSWDAHMIGMTALPEAKLAREAEMCFSLIAMVTDYDCWRQSKEDVTLEMVLKVMKRNSAAIKKVLPEIVGDLAERGHCTCQDAARDALVTRPALIPPETRQKLSLFYDKYWK